MKLLQSGVRRPASRPTTHEVALVREARAFVRARIRELEAMLRPARALRQRLARTDAYRRVDGIDDAQQDPVWDAAATLEICFERALEELVDSLRRDSSPRGTRRRPRRR